MENETIFIGGRYEVKFDKEDLPFSKYHTVINGHKFDEMFWWLARQVSENDKAKVIVLDHIIELETINKILIKLNSL